MKKTHLIMPSLMIFLSMNLCAQINFKKADKLTTNSNFYAVQIADMNNDGLNDVIGATSYLWGSSDEDAKIYIYLQDSFGKLSRKTEIAYPKQYPGIKSLAIGDLNNDSLKDLIIAYSDSIGISYQTSINNFSDFESYYCYRTVDQVLCQDINHDSLVDIVAKNDYYNSYLSILYQTKTGFNKQLVSNSKHYAFKFLELGDFNNDGLSDVVYHSPYDNPETNIFVMINDSILGLTKDSLSLNYLNNEKNRNLNDLSVGDFNSDGYLDVLGLNIFTDSIYIWANSQTGFKRLNKIKTYEYSDRIGTVDLNCDCKKEIIVIGDFSISTHESIDAFKQFSTYNIPNQYSSPTMWYNQYSIGDLNNDNKIDIAIAFLDGIVIMENTSKPISFSSIDTINRIDTLISQQDTLKYKIQQRSIIDTINNSIVYQNDSLNIILYYENGHVKSDTLFIRKGTFCNKPYIDSLLTNQINQFFSISEYDSSIFYSSYDTVAIINKIQNIVKNDLQIFPNPANDYIKILFPISEDHSKCIIEILSLDGRYVLTRSNFKIYDNPVSININDLRRGVYLIKLIYDDKIIIKKLIKN